MLDIFVRKITIDIQTSFSSHVSITQRQNTGHIEVKNQLHACYELITNKFAYFNDNVSIGTINMLHNTVTLHLRFVQEVNKRYSIHDFEDKCKIVVDRHLWNKVIKALCNAMMLLVWFFFLNITYLITNIVAYFSFLFNCIVNQCDMKDYARQLSNHDMFHNHCLVTCIVFETIIFYKDSKNNSKHFIFI